MEKYFLWFECFVKGSYLDYIEITKYISLDKLYYLKDYTFYMNIDAIDKLYYMLIDKNLKIKCEKKYIKLKENNIEIIDITSKYYFNTLKAINNRPLLFFVKGNKDKLVGKKVYIYNKSYFNKYGKDTYNYYLSCRKSKRYVYISNNLNKDIDIYICNRIGNREDITYVSFFNNNILEYMCYILEGIFIPQAYYDKELVGIIDLCLDYNKDILVSLNNGNYKEAYFSNYLIYNGARIFLSEKDI